MARMIINQPLILLLILQPLLAVGLLLYLRRQPAARKLVLALITVGVIGALVAAVVTFLRSTAPIAPYELGPGAWRPSIYLALWSLYVGFGLGVFGAAAVALPLRFLTRDRK